MVNQKTWLVILAVFMTMTTLGACPNESGCRECGVDSEKQSICLYCENGYLDPSTKTCMTNVNDKISNCLTYKKISDKIVCHECENGFVADVNGKCLPCNSKDCAICNVNGECLACKNSIVLIDQTCDPKQKCQDTNCAVCTETDVAKICRKCNAGFMRNEVSVCVKAMENCELGDTSAGKCVRCTSGYFISDTGKCLNYFSSGIGIVWWLFIIASILAIGYFSYYYFVLKKREREATEDAQYLHVADVNE